LRLNQEGIMNLNNFAKLVAVGIGTVAGEGKKIQMSIAQIKEVMKKENELTKGEFYKLIRRIDG